jgi:hypothetical protein
MSPKANGPAVSNGPTLEALAVNLADPVPKIPLPSSKLTPRNINTNKDLPSGVHTRAITRFKLRLTRSSPQTEFKLRDLMNGVAITKECTRVERKLFQYAEGRELMEAYWATKPLRSFDSKLNHGQLSIKKELPFPSQILSFIFLIFLPLD